MNGLLLTARQMERAQVLTEELVRRSEGENREVAIQLQNLLTPRSLSDLILSIPAESHKQRIQKIGISPQGYYNLLNGTSRPQHGTAAKLAKLTGLTADAIQRAGP